MHVGSIGISSSGQAGIEIFIRGVPNTYDVKTIIDQYRFPLRARQLVRELGFAQRQMVEILKAVSRGARVLILDEPTSSLSLREEERLFAIMDAGNARPTRTWSEHHQLREGQPDSPHHEFSTTHSPLKIRSAEIYLGRGSNQRGAAEALPHSSRALLGL